MIKSLNVDVLAGIPFLESKDISVRQYKRQVLIGDNIIYTYGSSLLKHSKAHVLRTVASTTIWPGDYFEVEFPKSALDRDSLLAGNHTFLDPLVCLRYYCLGNKIHIENTVCNHVSLRKHEHFSQIRPVYVPSTDPEPVTLQSGTKITSRTMLSHLFRTQHESQLI